MQKSYKNLKNRHFSIDLSYLGNMHSLKNMNIHNSLKNHEYSESSVFEYWDS